MKQTALKKFLKFLYICFICLVLLVAAANLYVFSARVIFGNRLPTVFGYTTAVVVSGSMRPAIEVDDVILIKKQAAYQVGDIIVYETADYLITHRVVEVTDKGYITKGDANTIPDAEVAREAVRGRVVKVMHTAGRVLEFLKTPLGMLVLVAGVFVVLYLPEILSRIFGKRSDYIGKRF